MEWGGRWEGGSEEKGHGSTYGSFLLMYDQKKNSINSYPSIKKKKLEKKEIQKLSCHLKFYTLNFRASFFPTRLMALMQIMNMKKSHLKG